MKHSSYETFIYYIITKVIAIHCFNYSSFSLWCYSYFLFFYFRKVKFFKSIFNILTVCVSLVCIHACDENHLELEFQEVANCPSWTVGIECVLSLRTLYTNHWTTSINWGVKFIHMQMWILSFRRCDVYSWLSNCLYLERTIIQKRRVQLSFRYWGKKTNCLWSASWDWMTQTFNP